ncbi:Transposase, Mutator family [Clostridium luticellarii]|uniref:Mutator family transposase n=1 Tax=Clostridium luticellarii TaxID=1691940 RepID=A0A2T0BL92_9CLOT|nr:Transposase, Mutator family [Clostridium luticellarii]
MEEHLGREKYVRLSDENKDYGNGYSPKNIRTSFGPVKVNVPRDRKSEFEPKIVKKYETVCSELDKKVIGLYARGMSVDDIKSEIDELYGVDISPAMISKITNKVMDTALAWQNRALNPIYGCSIF